MTPLFQSFFMGGFECATHRRRDGAQIDVLAATGHATRAAYDYRLLQQAGVLTVRDGLRWHLIEATPGVYDWSSFLPMLDASLATGTQVLWDLCHWGVPTHLDPFSADFAPRFAAFAAAAASLIRERSGGNRAPVPFYCPINEISFWAWVGGDMEAFAPHGRGRGDELKSRLAAASIAAIAAVRAVEPRARFLQAEPIIHIAPEYADLPEYPHIIDHVDNHVAAQYQAWDMLRGDLRPELGGTPAMLDLIGVNYYWNNQWVHGGDRMPPGHPDHRPAASDARRPVAALPPAHRHHRNRSRGRRGRGLVGLHRGRGAPGPARGRGGTRRVPLPGDGLPRLGRRTPLRRGLDRSGPRLDHTQAAPRPGRRNPVAGTRNAAVRHKLCIRDYTGAVVSIHSLFAIRIDAARHRTNLL